MKLSLYSKGRNIAISVTDVAAAAARRDGAVVQLRWHLDLIYAVWLSDEVGQADGNICFNIILCDAPTVKSRTYTGTQQYRVVHSAPPSSICSMSSTHAYLRAEISSSIAQTFVSELKQFYTAGNVPQKHHHILFSKPPSRAGWKKYNDRLLMPVRARHYERVGASLTTTLGRWLQKWAKLSGDARKKWEQDPWFTALCDKGEAIIEDYIRLVK